jgi:hypothetical protein
VNGGGLIEPEVKGVASTEPTVKGVALIEPKVNGVESTVFNKICTNLYTPPINKPAWVAKARTMGIRSIM